VDYRHPSLGGGLGPGYKIAYGYDFAGDNFTGAADPVPDSDPMDCSGTSSLFRRRDVDNTIE